MLRMRKGAAAAKPRHPVLDYFIETEATFQCLVEVGSGNGDSSDDGEGDVPEGSGGPKLCDQILKKAADSNKGRCRK